jgi:hypothetical protein
MKDEKSDVPTPAAEYGTKEKNAAEKTERAKVVKNDEDVEEDNDLESTK